MHATVPLLCKCGKHIGHIKTDGHVPPESSPESYPDDEELVDSEGFYCCEECLEEESASHENDSLGG